MHSLGQGESLRGRRGCVRHDGSGDWRLAVACAGEMRLNLRGSKLWRRARAQHRSPDGRLELEMARWADVDGAIRPSADIAGSHRIESLHVLTDRRGRAGRANGWRQLWISQIGRNLAITRFQGRCDKV